MQYRIVVLSVMSVALMEGSALAGPREDTLAGISRCSNIGNDRSFLDCIYGAVQPLRASLGLTPALPAQVSLVPPTQPPASPRAQPPATINPIAVPGHQNNGLLGRIFGAGASQLQMSSYTFDKRGRFTVTLSNGEVWRQVSNDTAYAHLGGQPSDYMVSLTDGDSGNTTMNVRGEPGTFSVQRVR